MTDETPETSKKGKATTALEQAEFLRGRQAQLEAELEATKKRLETEDWDEVSQVKELKQLEVEENKAFWANMKDLGLGIFNSPNFKWAMAAVVVGLLILGSMWLNKSFGFSKEGIWFGTAPADTEKAPQTAKE